MVILCIREYSKHSLTHPITIILDCTDYHTDQCRRTRTSVNTLRPRQNGHHFTDDIYKYIFMNENVWISIKISLKFVIAQIAPLSFQGRHRTQTQTSEVRWAVRFSGHWVVTSMFAQAILKRPSQRQLKKTSNGRRSQLNQYWSYKPHSNFKPTWNFLKVLYVSFKWYFWQK